MKKNNTYKKVQSKASKPTDILQNKVLKNLQVQVTKLKKRTELKTLDFTGSSTINNTGQLIAYSINIPNGPANGERIGNEIKLFSLSAKFNFSFDITNTGQVSQIRVMIFRYKDNYDNLAGFLQPQLWLENIETISPYKPEAKESFVFYVDKVIQLSLQRNPQQIFNKYIKLNNLKATYNDTVGNVAANNHLFCYVFSDQPVNQPSMNTYFRLYYSDA